MEKLVVASRANSERRRYIQYGLVAISLLIGTAGAAYGIWVSQLRLQMLADIYLLRKVLSSERERALMPSQEFRECTRCPLMVVLPEGIFLMGSPDGQGSDDERPQYMVAIPQPFSISKFEVTFDQWDTCYELGGCRNRPDDNGWDADQPVINVTWDDAQEYVAWLSKQTGKQYRLLTEAEYEYAARGGALTSYPWGDDIGTNNANCNGCGSRWDNKQAAPVGQFKANGFGLHDMVGNVWEWVQDCYHDSYRDAPADGLGPRTTFVIVVLLEAVLGLTTFHRSVLPLDLASLQIFSDNVLGFSSCALSFVGAEVVRPHGRIAPAGWGARI